jgi:hypothetical protein
MIRDNLVYNPSFSGGTTGWSGYNSATLATLTTDKYIGYQCIKVTKVSTSTDSGIFGEASYRPNVTLSAVYSASAYLKVPAGQESIDARVSIAYYNGATFVSSQTGAVTTIDSSMGWTRVTVEDQTAPSSGVTKVTVIVLDDKATKTIGNYYYIDAVKLENSAIATQFIEGRDQGQENKKVNTALSPLPIPHITGMQLNADIMLNDIVFNTIDENDVVWVCSDIQGWWNLPDSEVPDLTRGLDDGSYDVRGRYSARNLTFTGSLLCPNPESAAVARNKLIEAIDLIHKGGWLLVAEEPTKAAFVRLSGRPEIVNTKARGRIDFSIGLRAANPIKYEWNWEDPDGYETATVTNGSSATLANSGNTNVPIVFTIAGGASANLTAPITINNTTLGQTLTVVKTLRSAAYSVNITRSERTGNVVTLTTAGHSYYIGDVVTVANVTTVGRTGLNEAARTITDVTATTITYTSANSGTLADLATNGDIGLDSADTLEVDCYNKTALFNGSAFYNGGTVSARSYIDPLVDWIVLAPGDNTITFTDSGGTTDLAIKYRSGWIG